MIFMGMMNKINNIKKKRKEFQALNNNEAKFINYIWWFLKYKTSINEYFENELYTNKDHREYINKQHKVKRSWSKVYPNFMPTKSKMWEILHYIDFLVAKVYCPGLDAMNYFQYEFYDLSVCKRRTFVTEGYLAKMDVLFNGDPHSPRSKELRGILSDKCKFNSVFKLYVSRKWINAREMDIDSWMDFCQGLDEVIVKPLDGIQGKGIYKACINSREEQTELFKKVIGKNYIIEEVVRQNKVLASLNPSSVNTVRVYSVYHSDKVVITKAALRMGNGPSVIDNYSAGGLAAEIDVENGIIISKAISQKNDKEIIHPFSGEKIIGLQIPEWNKIIDTIKAAHCEINELRYIAWDVVVCEDGKIAIIEANTSGGVNFQQQPLLTGVLPLYKKLI